MPRESRVCVALLFLLALSLMASPGVALEDAPAAALGKIAVPDANAQRAARDRINDSFDIAKAKKPEEKIDVAKQLLKAAADPKNDPVVEYATLTMARDLAVSAGDADTALAAITEMQRYAIDGLKLKADTLAAILKSPAKPPHPLDVASTIDPLIDEALEADHYAVARQVAELNVSAAHAAKDAEVLAQANARLAAVREAETAYAAAKGAITILSTKPRDPAASLALGRFEAFMKRHWEKGLPLLASGSDAGIKSLAQTELFIPTGADKQMQLADGWWTASAKEKGISQEHIRQHAIKWYAAALPSLSGLDKAKAEKRIKERPLPAAHPGWTDLLKKVDAKRDTVSGTWTFDGEKLTARGGQTHVSFRVDVKPQGPYEMRVEFARPDGAGAAFGVYLPVGDTGVMICVEPHAMGLDTVDGKSWAWAPRNDTRIEGVFGADAKKHLLDILVWPGEQTRIIVLFDGKKGLDWSGPSSKLKVYEGWAVPAPMSSGFHSNNTAFVITGFAIRESASQPPPPMRK